MGLLSDSDTDIESTAGGQSERAGLQRLIREEVRAVVREEIRATAAAEAFEPAPPSYDSGARLLAAESDVSPLLASDAARSLAATSLNEESRSSNVRKGIRRLPTWLRIILVFWPFPAVIISLPTLSVSGHDKLQLAILSFFLVFAQYAAFMFAAMISLLFCGVSPQSGTQPTPEPQEDETPPKRSKEQVDYEAATIILYHFLLSFVFFGLIMAGWLGGPQRGMWQRSELAARFDAKITGHNALSFLTKCLYDVNPNRNATIDNFTYCLTKLGMPQNVVYG